MAVIFDGHVHILDCKDDIPLQGPQSSFSTYSWQLVRGVVAVSLLCGELLYMLHFFRRRF